MPTELSRLAGAYAGSSGGASAETAAIRLAAQIRGAALEMIVTTGFGFAGSCMSVADVLAALAVGWQLPRPALCATDVLLLSKGHAAPALYALAYGWDWRAHGRYAALGSKLQGHPNRARCPEVAPTTTGSLGLGVGHALGMLLGRRARGQPSRLAVILGDGESQAGVTAEAMAFAARARLRGVMVIVDANGLQSAGPLAAPDQVGRQLSAVADDFAEVDGHDVGELLRLLARVGPDSPFTAVLAHTSRGAGAPELGLDGRPMSFLPERRSAQAAMARFRREGRPS